jgi:hypothetical protein
MKLKVDSTQLHLEPCRSEPHCSCHSYLANLLKSVDVRSFWNALLFFLDLDPSQEFFLEPRACIRPGTHALNVYYSPLASSLFLLRRKPENMKKSESIFLNDYKMYDDIRLIFTVESFDKELWFVFALLSETFKNGRKKGKIQFLIPPVESVPSLVERALKPCTSNRLVVDRSNQLHLNDCSKQPCRCSEFVSNLLKEYNNRNVDRNTDLVSLTNTVRFLSEVNPMQTFSISPRAEIDDEDSFTLNVYYSRKANSLFLLRRKPENIKKSELILRSKFYSYDDMTLIFSRPFFTNNLWYVHATLMQIFKTGKKLNKDQFLINQEMDCIEISHLVQQSFK